MKQKNRRTTKILVIVLVVSILIIASAGVLAFDSSGRQMTNTESIHDKVDISEVTGEIVDPPMLTSAASSIAGEKEWYEYIYYSGNPVGYYYLSDDSRVAFYDPYDYSDALIMEVDDTLTDWSSNDSLQVSYTTGDSMTDTSGKSYETSSSVQSASGQDISTTTAEDSVVTTSVTGKVETYNYSKSGDTHTDTDTETWHDEWSLAEAVKVGVDALSSETTLTGNYGWTWDYTTSETSQDSIGYNYNIGEYQSADYGYTKDNTTTTSTTNYGEETVKTTIADRITEATNYSASSSLSLSTSNSTTITKTYNASHFNSNGSPLQWKVIEYTVKMPMRYQVEYLVDDEWIFGDYSYCLLTTIQGTTRSWLQNNVAYYEHWGTGEAVTWDEFWGQFFTTDSLIAAYKNRLYPDY